MADIHAPGGIRIPNPSKQAEADPSLRPCPSAIQKNTARKSNFKCKLDKPVTKIHTTIFTWKLGRWFREPFAALCLSVYFAVHYPTNCLGEHTNIKCGRQEAVPFFMWKEISPMKESLTPHPQQTSCEVCELQLTNKICQRSRTHVQTMRVK